MEQSSGFTVSVVAVLATGDTSEFCTRHGGLPAEPAKPITTCVLKVAGRHREAVLAQAWTPGAAGCDLHTIEGKVMQPGNRHVFRTRLAVAIPPGTYGQLASRSSLALKGILVLGGVIDQDYRAKIILANYSERDVFIEPQSRVAQIIIRKIFHAEVMEVGALTTSARQPTTTCVLKVVRRHRAAVLPQAWTPGAAGCDLHTFGGTPMQAGTRYVFHTGLAVELPMGTYGQIVSRSSLALQGIMVLGIIDQDCRDTGKIRGCVSHSAFTQKPFHQFKGIPYAKAPLGTLRFRAPQPAVPWESVLDTTNYGSMCCQLGESNVYKGNEDCLFANVFSPSVDKNRPLYPVIVLIHGGSFQQESGASYDPSYWMEEDVVLVTFNYRLGIMGFLSTSDAAIQGNAGLKDQVLLLKWVRENIRHFNGNPERVTLLGISSGAASVHLHMISPMSDGLFHQAISQSGTALCPWAIVRKPEIHTKRMSSLLNCTTETTQSIKDCLLEKSAEELVLQQPGFHDWYIDPIVPLGPVIEIQGEDPIFLPEFPYRLIKEGRFKKDIPWILGVNSEEGLLHAADIVHYPILTRVIDWEWDRAAPVTLLFKYTTFDKNRTSTAIRNFYFGDESIGRKTLDNLIQMYSDRYFFHGTHHAAKSHVENGATAPIFLYYFDHVGDNSIIHLTLEMNKNITGVCHYDQVQYLFKLEDFPEIGAEQNEFASKFRKTLLGFVNGGKPGDPDWRHVELADITDQGSLQYNVIGTSDGVIKEPFNERLKFWDSLDLMELEREIDETFIKSLVDNSKQEKNEL
ncbi:unnamed protein product [Allacma fusca]|uniref:Uncharacterized protein n=1 Tax=Allacma fusca TaxID=39272 RepID=A0A8J2LU52_9HEXA|nr:unnamed protein product [Allacma fusca]